jgi:hypothetical protein
MLGNFLPKAKLNRQAPHQNVCRCQLDYAIEAEGDQHKASGCYPSPNGNDGFNVIHPIVSHSSLNASRMSSRRSDRGGRKSGSGAQESAIRAPRPAPGRVRPHPARRRPPVKIVAHMPNGSGIGAKVLKRAVSAGQFASSTAARAGSGHSTPRCRDGVLPAQASYVRMCIFFGRSGKSLIPTLGDADSSSLAMAPRSSAKLLFYFI